MGFANRRAHYLICLLFFFLSPVSHGGVVLSPSYTGLGIEADLSGLQWHTLPETEGYSRQEMELMLGDALSPFFGWRYANSSEVSALLFSLVGDAFGARGTEAVDAIFWFFDNFGLTDAQRANWEGGNSVTLLPYYGSEFECGSFVSAPYCSLVVWANPQYLDHNSFTGIQAPNLLSADLRYGHLLVMDAASIPSPETLFLMIVPLIGLLGTNRSK